MISFGALGITQPWFLVGLFALPIIWYLMRMIPPKPDKVVFPPLRLLAGLQVVNQTLQTSPWWLLLFRMLLLALIIIAFSRPVWNPDRAEKSGALDMIIVLDNGWATAADWEKRKKTLESVLSQAAQNEASVLFATTSYKTSAADTDEKYMFRRYQKVREQASNIQPLPYVPTRLELIKQLEKQVPKGASFHVIWLSDGLNYGTANEFAKRLGALAGARGTFDIYKNETSIAQGIYVKPDSEGFQVRIIRTGGEEKTGQVFALNAKGERLGEATYTFAKAANEAKTKIKLPTSIRNQVSRILIANEDSAAGIYLLDSRSLRYRAGLVTGEASNISQPLLSPKYYVEKALKPYAEIVSSEEKNISVALTSTISQKPSIIILTDVAKLGQGDIETMSEWVNEGGVLVRFAGPAMEKNIDSLLPINIRGNGRNLGGALSWRKPQGVAAFGKKSPFLGLEVPDEVKVKKQVLSDPSLRTDGVEIWAELKDGTPLVTARKTGEGWLVFFHITANSDWSNLPISGLFVEMLKRLTELSRPELSTAVNGSDKETDSTTSVHSQYLPPHRVLNGFGTLVEPSVDINPLESSNIVKIKLRFGTPPGYYGRAAGRIAINIVRERMFLKPFDKIPKDASVLSYSVATTIILFPWLISAALLLLLLDSLFWLTLTKRGGYTATIALLLAVTALGFVNMPSTAHAEKENQAKLDFARKASTGTHLAYVITGNQEIDRISKFGLLGLSKVIGSRTAVEPGDPIGVDIENDELSFFPILYWPIHVGAKDLSDKVLSKVDAYMRKGGLILFDTRDYQTSAGSVESGSTPAMRTLQRLFRKLNIPKLDPVVEGHVVTKSFYLMKNFPGRWEGGKLWAESGTNPNSRDRGRERRADGVSSILITSNDFAGAWALDENYRPLLPTVPGGELQREMAFRSGINIVMYALTGNYKADQVHIPALLQRLGQ